MLNYIWAFMMGVGIVWAAFHGNLGAVTDSALSSAKEAVMLCITMLGVMSFWTGIMEIGRQSGLIERLSRRMGPVLFFLFPKIPKDHPAMDSIATNMIANILGLGWAATPAGLKAMEALQDLEEERREGAVEEATGSGAGQEPGKASWRVTGREPGRSSGKASWRAVENTTGGGRKKSAVPVAPGTASNEMCTFLIINISSLQLIPVNMIAYRSQYASVSPTAVVGPALVATLVSTLVGILYCKLMDR